MEPIDVLVAGAGPTGLTMACELRRFGLTVRVVDPAPRGTEHSKALVIHARTREVFAAMGMAGAVEADAQGLGRITLYFEGRRLGVFNFGQVLAPEMRPMFLDQSTTERLLAAHLEQLGGRVERGLKLVSFRHEGARVVATLVHDDGAQEQVAARWLVGCDGAHSAVRHGLGLAFDGAAYEDMFDQADVKLRWNRPQDEAIGFLRETGLVVFLPLPRGRHRILVMGGDGHSPEPTLAMFQKLADELLPGTELYDPEWVIRFRLHRRMAPKMAVGPVFLAGDAAHIHSPAGGQGMNTGIQDAFNLAWKLALIAGGGATAELAQTYDDERHPVAARTLAMTDRMFRMATGARTLWVRRLVMGAVARSRRIQARLARRISQTGVSYRGTRATIEARHWPRAQPLAGDRAPPSRLRDAQGAEVTVQALASRSPKLTLLLMHGPSRTAALSAVGTELVTRWPKALVMRDVILGQGDGDALSDPNGGMYREWGVRAPELIVLRPDGHVAVRAPLSRAQAVRQFAETWLRACG